MRDATQWYRLRNLVVQKHSKLDHVLMRDAAQRYGNRSLGLEKWSKLDHVLMRDHATQWYRLPKFSGEKA